MNQPWIIQQLTKSYHQTTVLNQLSLSLQHHEITGLLGVNGAGKSTLIKCMMGLCSIESGHANPPENQHIGYLPDLIQLPESLSALQLIQHALRVKKSPTTDAELTLSEIGLQTQAWNKRIATYSKGMRQRTALAFALAGKPDWLLLDEPMSGLDAIGRKQLLELLLQRHTQGAGIFICSHIVPDLVRLCDRILIFSQGFIQKDINIQHHSMDEITMVEEQLERLERLEHLEQLEQPERLHQQ